MKCKACGKKNDGNGYWRSFTTIHDPNYILCPSCSRGYKDHSKPIKILNLAERFQQMKRNNKNGNNKNNKN